MTRRTRRRLCVIGSAAAMGIGAPLWAPPLLGTLPMFRVEHVDVVGTVFLEPDEVIRLARVEAAASVWSDATVWEERVRSHPLVRGARVRRSGIRRLEIRVMEAEPLAFVAAETLVPVDVEGRELPLEPSTTGLNLPVLGGGIQLSNGRAGATARELLRVLRELKEYDAAFYRHVSEIWAMSDGSVEIRLVESGPAEAVLLRSAAPARDLRRIELALGQAAGLRVATADARFDGQVVLTTGGEG